MIPGNPPAATETSLDRLARNLRMLYEGGVGGPSPAGAVTDNAVMRWDGTDGRTAQNSGLIIDDSNNVSGIVALATTGVMTRTGQPTFSAHKGGSPANDQAGIVNNTFTKITFGTEVFDVGGLFSSSTWTPPAGKVLLTAHLFWSAGINTGNFIISVYKNGARFRDGIWQGVAGGSLGTGICIIDDTDGAATYEIYGFGSTATTLTVNGAASGTYFMGYML